MSKSALND